MNLKEIKQLVDHVNKSDLTEFSWSKDGERLVLKKEKELISAGPVAAIAPQAITAPAAPAAQAGAPAAETPAEESNLKEIKSPMVGTFYRSPSPDADAFASVGDKVSAGKVVCIVEAMKLMNEIESDVEGTIVEICVDDAQPVEYGATLFKVKPN